MLATSQESVVAIRDMLVRGAPLIGVTAAYGMAIAMAEDPSDENLKDAGLRLNTARPTAVNLAGPSHACRARWRTSNRRAARTPP